MGTWGAGSFENDNVLDWLASLSDWPQLMGAIDRVLLSESPPCGPDCCDAIGAAEVMAACFGRPATSPPEKVIEWANAHPARDVRLIARAEACIRRIEADSELQELWDEDGRHEAWHAEMRALLERLSKVRGEPQAEACNERTLPEE